MRILRVDVRPSAKPIIPDREDTTYDYPVTYHPRFTDIVTMTVLLTEQEAKQWSLVKKTHASRIGQFTKKTTTKPTSDPQHPNRLLLHWEHTLLHVEEAPDRLKEFEAFLNSPDTP